MAENLDAEFAKQSLRNGAHGDAGGGFAGAGAFQNVPGIVKIVLDGAREIGVARAGARNGLALLARTRRNPLPEGLRSNFSNRYCG